MKPAPFTYHAPSTLDEAVGLMADLGREEVRVLAGGQSLVPAMALRLARPAHLVDINAIAELATTTTAHQALHIGATVRHARFHDPAGHGGLGPLLAEVARHIAHYPIRQRGTFCGALANGDPASEWCLAAVTFDAVLEAQSRSGARAIPAQSFFKGPMTTALRPDEILVSTRLQQIAPDTSWGFEEFSARAGDFGIAMALVTFDVAHGKIVNARVGVGGVEANPRRIGAAEQALAGKSPGDAVFRTAGDAVAAAIEPLDDWQADSGERRRLAAALTFRALVRASGRPRA